MKKKMKLKMVTSEPATLTDDQMGQVSGGSSTHDEPIFGYNGKQIGKVDKFTGRIICWLCTHCRQPIYCDWLAYYCDKCDDWWYSRADYYWGGTKESLRAANALTL